MAAMNKFAAILYDSFLEIKDRKIFYFYWLVAGVIVIVFALLPSLNVNGRDILEGDILSPELLNGFIARFFDGFLGFAILLLVFGSAGLVPSFLSKGRVELVLSKPLDRWRLISLKFLAVYLVKALVLAIMATAIWLTISTRLGMFHWGFFLGLLFACLQLLVVYAIVFFLGVLTNSAAAAIMGYFIIRIGSDLLAGRKAIYPFIGEKSVWAIILDTLYHISPKIGQMSENIAPIITGKGIADFYPVWSTVLIGIVFFLAALLYFNRRDY
jgi:ABC-type transport system involved in multi-copper enzyme maturation permease subunit